MVNIVNVADLVNPESGLTYRQENNRLTHGYPIGAIVECLPYDPDPTKDYNEHTGLRLFIVDHTRDCDGTPLYTLSCLTPEEYQKQLAFARMCSVVETSNPTVAWKGEFLMHPSTVDGISEDSLKLISGPKATRT